MTQDKTTCQTAMAISTQCDPRPGPTTHGVDPWLCRAEPTTGKEDEMPTKRVRKATSAVTVLDLPLKEEPAEENRRSSPRVQRTFSAKLKKDGIALRGIDLSTGGMMVQTDQLVWPGNVVKAEILMDDGVSIEVSGKVVDLVPYSDQVAMRVLFDELSQKVKRSIAQWISQ